MDTIRLIITDNKIMADNIAEAFGYDREEDAGTFLYEEARRKYSGQEVIS